MKEAIDAVHVKSKWLSRESHLPNHFCFRLLSSTSSSGSTSAMGTPSKIYFVDHIGQGFTPPRLQSAEQHPLISTPSCLRCSRAVRRLNCTVCGWKNHGVTRCGTGPDNESKGMAWMPSRSILIMILSTWRTLLYQWTKE